MDNKESIENLNAHIRQFIDINDDLLQVNITFKKPIGEFDFGINIKTDYKDIKTVIGVKKFGYIYIDRSKSGDSLNSS